MNIMVVNSNIRVVDLRISDAKVARKNETAKKNRW